MGATVTYTVKGTNNEYTFNAENNKYTQAVLGREIEDKTISKAEMGKINGAMQRESGKDYGALEYSDLTSEEKVYLAKLNGYGDLYDLKINGGCLEITVKKSKWYMPLPELGTIKSDFLGSEDGILISKGQIPYGNDELITKRRNEQIESLQNDRGHIDYDELTLQEGDVIRIPLDKFVVKDSAKGFWGRLFD